LNAARLVILIAAFAGLGLGVVYVRTEQARSAARTLALELQWIELRGQWWELQGGVARMRTPERIRDRLGWYQSDLKPPVESGGSTTRPQLAVGER